MVFFVALTPSFPWNVLIFPAASEVGLEIGRALQDHKETRLYGAGVRIKDSTAAFHFRRLHEIPSIEDPACLSSLQRLIQKERIDALFPAHDDVLSWLSVQGRALPCALILSPPETVRLCRSKRATYESLQERVATPRLYDPIRDASLPFPLFVKPDRGQGSRGARLVRDRAALAEALRLEPDLVVMEALPGREYTVDCFSCRRQGLLYARARARVQTRTGIASIVEPAPHVPARVWAEAISQRLSFHGPWFFQLKEDAQGELKLLEVAPRVAGSMAFSRAQGPNFPLLALYEAAGVPLVVEDQAFRVLKMGRSLDVRFLDETPMDALYIDLDDTLILHDAPRPRVNTKLVALIFQCRNKGVPVCLVTRHEGDLWSLLDQCGLRALFDRVEHLPIQGGISKGSVVREERAVLIEDSFAERRWAQEACPSLRCFDPSGALCLLDERGA